jgi:hypothetical protein
MENKKENEINCRFLCFLTREIPSIRGINIAPLVPAQSPVFPEFRPDTVLLPESFTAL